MHQTDVHYITASMDAFDVMLGWLPSLTDLVIYGAMASASAAIFAISFFGIVGSFYRWVHLQHPAALQQLPFCRLPGVFHCT